MNSPDQTNTGKKQELGLFLFLTIILAPAVAIGFIGGYGLFVWLSQMLG